ncbi:MAG: HAD-IA family hydrolase [Methanomethylophilus sp.]|nr:HAD-IA family hydrolase [Methanomethylophilus sp.]
MIKASDTEAVIFDVDGTIFDSSSGIIHALRDALEEIGEPPVDDQTVRSLIGPPIGASIARIRGYSEEKEKILTKTFRSIYGEKYLNEASVYPGIEGLLKDLKSAGFRLGVATNKRRDFTERMFDEFGLSDYFIDVEGMDPEGTLDKTRIVGMCAEKLGAEKDRTVMVGDASSDFKAAETNGIGFIAVLYGFGYRSAGDVPAGHRSARTPRDIFSLLRFAPYRS